MSWAVASLPLITCRGRSLVQPGAQCLWPVPHETAASPPPTTGLTHSKKKSRHRKDKSCDQHVSTEAGWCVETSRRGAGGSTHSTALCVVRSVRQDEGLGLQRTHAVTRAEGQIPTAGQDHEEMCRDGGLIAGEKWEHKLEETAAFHLESSRFIA